MTQSLAMLAYDFEFLFGRAKVNPNTIRSLGEHCKRVMGRNPMDEGATFEEAKRQFEEWLQREGAARLAALDPNPCHCYEHCEDDDEGVERRFACRKRN